MVMSESSKKCPVHFDHRSKEFIDQPLEHLKEMRECPVMQYTEAHRGYWIAAKYADVKEAAKAADLFTNRYEPEPVDGVYWEGSSGVPRNPASVRLGLGEATGE